MAQQIQFIYLTQSDFDNLAVKESKLYFTSDTKRIYRGSDLYAATSFDKLNFRSIEASDIKVNGKAVSLEGHTHSASEIDGLGSAISAATQNFSQNGHTHVIADVTNLSGIVAGITNTTITKSQGQFTTLTVGGSNVSVQGHTHSISDVTGLSSAIQDLVPIEFITSSAFDALTTKDSNKIYFVDDNSIYKGDELYGATSFDQLEFSDIEARSITVNGSAVAIDGHTHAFNDITGLSDVLSGITSSSISKDTVSAQTGTFTSSIAVGGSNVSLEGHTHSVADIDGLTSALSDFASASHSHVIADVTGLQSALDGKASSDHTHGISDITGLSASLSTFASSAHTHIELSGVTESSVTKDTVTAAIGNFRLLSVSGSANFAVNNVSANAVSVNGTPVSIEGHTHSLADVSGLSDALYGITSTGVSKQTVSASTGTFNAINAQTAIFSSLSVTNSATIDVTDLIADTISVNNLNLTGSLTVGGESVATQAYVLAQISAAIGAVLSSAY